MNQTRIQPFAALLVPGLLAIGCDNDFNESLRRAPDGAIDPFEARIATDSQMSIHSPGDEVFVAAESDTPSVMTVAEIDDGRVVVESRGAGSSLLLFRTDGTVSSDMERARIEVREPEYVEWEIEPDWVAVTEPFELTYKLLDDEDVRLHGVGFKAITQAPGLALTERPREVRETTGLIRGYSQRTLEVASGAVGTFTLEASVGQDIELQRISPDEVDDIRVELPSQVRAGDPGVWVWARGFYDGKPVLGFDEFGAKSRSKSVCVIDDRQALEHEFRAVLELKRAGTCTLKLKSKLNDWEDEVSFEVTAE